MDDKKFDEIIKQKLQDLPVEGTDHWDLMEERLDLEFGELASLEDVVEFDAVVSEKLNDYQVSYDGESWASLEDRMIKEEALKRKIYVSKALEALVFLLLIFTFVQIYPSLQKTDQKHTIKPESSATIAGLIEVPSSTIDLTSQANSTSKETKDISIDLSSPNQTEPSNSGNEKDIASSIVVQTSPETSEKKNLSSSLINGATTPVKGAVSFVDAEISESQTGIISQANQSIDGRLANIVLSPLGLLASNLDLDHHYYFNLSLDKGLKGESNMRKYWLNAFTSVDYNIINSPYDPVYGKEAYTVTSYDYTTGGYFSVEQGRAELGLGMIYSVKSYEPRIIKEITGRFSETFYSTKLTNISFDILGVDMSLRYNLLEQKGWKFYTQSAVALNMVSRSAYEVVEKEEGNVNLAPGTNTGTMLYEKDFEDGIIEGGTFSVNSFFTLQGGLGISKKITDRLSMYAETNYKHHMFTGGLGPNFDKIHTLGFQVGTKIRLK